MLTYVSVVVSWESLLSSMLLSAIIVSPERAVLLSLDPPDVSSVFLSFPVAVSDKFKFNLPLQM